MWIICPWLSWIARKTPTLEVAGSNPVGQANAKRGRKSPFCVGLADGQAECAEDAEIA